MTTDAVSGIPRDVTITIVNFRIDGLFQSVVDHKRLTPAERKFKHVIFRLSRPAMDRLAIRYYQELPLISPPPPPGRVGLYPLQGIDVYPRGVWMHIDRTVSFYYAPDGLLPYTSDCWVRLSGDWYIDTRYEGVVLWPTLNR